MKSTISKLKIHTGRMDEAQDRFRELDNKVERNTQVGQLHVKRLKNYEHSLREL